MDDPSSGPPRRRASRAPAAPAGDLEAVFALAYDRRQRAYVLVVGGGEEAAAEVVDDVTAAALIRQVEQCGLGRPARRRDWLGSSGKELTPKEVQVLQAAAEGLSNRGIASRLHIAESTAKIHLQSIFVKLGVQSRTQAVIVALSQGWVTLGKVSVRNRS